MGRNWRWCLQDGKRDQLEDLPCADYEEQKEEKEKDPGRAQFFPISENERKVIDKLEEMSKRKGVGMTNIALALVSLPLFCSYHADNSIGMSCTKLLTSSQSWAAGKSAI